MTVALQPRVLHLPRCQAFGVSRAHTFEVAVEHRHTYEKLKAYRTLAGACPYPQFGYLLLVSKGELCAICAVVENARNWL